MRIIKKHLIARKIKTLSKDVCYDLIKKSQAGCKRSRELLITHNIPLVISIAGRYQISGSSCLLSYEDLFQEGIMGLNRAIDLFDLKRNLHFSTYADIWIRQKIRRYLEDNRGPVRTPVYMLALKRQYRKLDLQEGDEIDARVLKRLAKDNNVSIKTMSKAIDLVHTEVRIDDPLTTYQLEDLIDERQIDVHRLDFQQMIDYLNPIERFVIERRMSGWSLARVGVLQNISRERVRQIQVSAMKKLKALVNNSPRSLKFKKQSNGNMQNEKNIIKRGGRKKRTLKDLII